MNTTTLGHGEQSRTSRLRRRAMTCAVLTMALAATLSAAPAATAENPASSDRPDADASAQKAKVKLRHCGNLVFTPHSGDVLGDIKARGIGCRRARRKLTAWRRNGYRPLKGPRGYRCDWGPQGPRPAARVRCRRIGASLPVISYRSGA